MDESGWKDRLQQVGEEKITKWVNVVLSKSAGDQLRADVLQAGMSMWSRLEGILQEVFASMELPTRDELRVLREQLDALNGQVVGLRVRVDELQQQLREGKEA